MSIFKKKSQIEIKIEPPKFDVPEVIKESKIKPTKCKSCRSIYQAKHSQLIREQDLGFIYPKYHLLAQCPICKNFNDVEFEEAEE